jgi:hypothetical protein
VRTDKKKMAARDTPRKWHLRHQTPLLCQPESQKRNKRNPKSEISGSANKTIFG